MRSEGPLRSLALEPQLQVAQWPMELLGLVVKGLVVLVVKEEERVLKMEEGAGQVEKMVPPSSFL